MAAPVYSTDLTTLDAADATTNWTAIGTGAISAETDYFIEGSACISKVGWTAATRGMIFNSGSDRASLFTGHAAFIGWVEYHNPNLLDTYANGGIQLIIGSGTAAYNAWFVSGSDKIPLGGWHPFACDPTVDTNGDATTGSPSAVQQYLGVLAKVLGSGALKGNPLGVDVIRIGREARCEFGDAGNGYATLVGLEAYGNSPASGRRWGLILNREGAYYMQGALVLGTATNAVDFRDSDRAILILDTPKCHADFNEIEIRNASSRVDWTRFTVTALGTTSKGKFTVTNDCDVNLDSCSFIDMNTFALGASTSFLNCVFIRCNTITAPGSNMSGSTFTTPTVAADTSAIVWNANQDTDGYLNDTVFSKGTNAHHAVELGTSSPTTVTFRRIAFTGFNASNAQNDSTIHVKRTTGTVTINLIGCSGNISYKSAGATVTLVVDPVTTAVTVKDVNTGSAIQSARVLLLAADGTGPMPYQESTTITRSGSTATATCTGHGLVTNDYVVIKGANQQEYNGVFQVTVTGTDTFTYTVAGTPATPATGTIVTTGAPLYGTTDVNGLISASRSFTTSQPITGRVRKATTGTLYKTGTVSGTISNTAGFSATVQLIPDT